MLDKLANADGIALRTGASASEDAATSDVLAADSASEVLLEVVAVLPAAGQPHDHCRGCQ